MTDADIVVDAQTGEILDKSPVIPFAAWLQDLRGGRCHAEITDALHELVDAVTSHGKDGELTIKFKVKPVGEGSDQVMVVDDVIVKAPQPARSPSLFFVDDANNLTRDDPTRMTLPLRDVPPQATPDLKEAR